MKIIRPVQVTQAGSFTRNSIGTYFDANGVMQTAVANALRITYDPSNLSKAPYAMMEQAATNMVWYSEQFDNAVWTVTNLSVSPNAVTAPNGTLTADKISDSTLNAQHYIYYNRTGSNETITFSAHVKPAGRTIAYLAISNFVNASCGAYFDLAAGVVMGTDPANFDFTSPSAKIQALPNGWFRCSFTVTKGSANTTSTAQINVGVMQNGAPTLVFAGDGASGVHVWGAQLETGTVATSYIPTTNALVTRAADTIAATGLLYSNIPETDYPAWSGTTAYVAGDKVLDAPNHKIYSAITGLRNVVAMAASSTVFSMVDANNVAVVPANGTPVKLSSTGTLPSGFVAGTLYYVVAASTTSFSLASTVGGAAISSGTAGTGTYSLTTQVNLNKPLNDTANWLPAGMDNRWSMFDQSVTTQSTNAGNITIAFAPGSRMDSLIGLNCSASKVQISMVDAVSGVVVYSTTVALTSNSGISDMYNYFYEPIVQIPDFVLDDMPVGVSSNSVIVFTAIASPTAKIGGVVVGLSKDIGLTEWGTKIGTVSYSVKTQDTFGNYTVTPRAFSKKADFTIQVPTGTVDFLQNILTQFRDTPVVYIGYNAGGRTKFNSTVIYGFYKDYSIDIAYNAFSVCSLTVEGLT